jgi:hypothetical protein
VIHIPHSRAYLIATTNLLHQQNQFRSSSPLNCKFSNTINMQTNKTHPNIKMNNIHRTFGALKNSWSIDVMYLGVFSHHELGLLLSFHPHPHPHTHKKCLAIVLHHKRPHWKKWKYQYSCFSLASLLQPILVHNYSKTQLDICLWSAKKLLSLVDDNAGSWGCPLRKVFSKGEWLFTFTKNLGFGIMLN